MFLPGKSMKTMHFQCISLKIQDFHEISMKMYAFTRYFPQKIRFSIDFHMNFKICMKFKWKSMFSPHISLKKHDFPLIFIEMLRFPWKFNENACFHYIFPWKNMIFNRFSLKNQTCPRFFHGNLHCAYISHRFSSNFIILRPNAFNFIDFLV